MSLIPFKYIGPTKFNPTTGYITPAWVAQLQNLVPNELQRVEAIGPKIYSLNRQKYKSHDYVFEQEMASEDEALPLQERRSLVREKGPNASLIMSIAAKYHELWYAEKMKNTKKNK